MNPVDGEVNWAVPLAVLIIGSFMSVLDTSIVNVAIPKMQVALSAAPDDIEWVVTAYTLVQPGRLRRELARTRQDGYAQTSEEMSLGACSVAVPVRDGTDEVVAALGIVVPSLKRDKPRLVAALQVAAQGIRRSLVSQSGRPA